MLDARPGVRARFWKSTKGPLLLLRRADHGVLDGDLEVSFSPPFLDFQNSIVVVASDVVPPHVVVLLDLVEGLEVLLTHLELSPVLKDGRELVLLGVGSAVF